MKGNANFLYFHKVWLALGWVWIVYVVYLSLIPEPPGPDGPWWEKFNHSLAYTFLMLWFAQLFRAISTKFLIALGLTALGVAIEFAQEQTGYRQFEFSDMGANAIGVAIGLLLGETALALVLHGLERVFRVGR